jgi:hypothetical protein
MCELIDTTIEEVRSLAIRLRPGVLDHLGLVEAIEWYTADFEKRYDITCVFEHDDGPEIRGNIATAAYRISQEALTNVARHASATRAKVTMSFEQWQFVAHHQRITARASIRKPWVTPKAWAWQICGNAPTWWGAFLMFNPGSVEEPGSASRSP